MEFGNFDPSFIGVTLSFESTDAWQRFDEFVRQDAPAPLESLTPPERLLAIRVRSVLAHEVRHYHDFLLSPYQTGLFCYRLQAALNIPELLRLLFRREGNCLPVPLTRWGLLGDSRRTDYLAALGPRKGEPWTAPQVPKFAPFSPTEAAGFRDRLGSLDDEGVLSGLLSLVSYQMQRVSELASDPTSPLQPFHCAELSGILAQLEDVQHTYGQDASREFVHGLLADGRGVYGLALKLALALSGEASVVSSRVAGAAALWSLVGSFRKDGWRARPNVRLAALCALGLKGQAASEEAELPELLDYWSNTLGLSTVDEGLKETEHLYRVILRGIPALRESVAWRDESFLSARQLEGAIESIAGASAAMRHQFQKAPTTYLAPDQYIRDASGLPNPAVRLIFEGGNLLRMKRDEENRNNRNILWAADDGDDTCVRSMLWPYELSDVARVDGLEMNGLTSLMSICDLLFSESTPRRTSFDVRRAAELLHEVHGWRTVELQV